MGRFSVDIYLPDPSLIVYVGLCVCMQRCRVCRQSVWTRLATCVAVCGRGVITASVGRTNCMAEEGMDGWMVDGGPSKAKHSGRSVVMGRKQVAYHRKP